MYIRKIQVKNYGAIKSVDYTLPFNEEGNPIPVILVGKNGTGKTLLLSNILHSLIEIKRKFYNRISEVSDNNYYRVGSKMYIKDNENFSYFKIEFDDAYIIDLMRAGIIPRPLGRNKLFQITRR